MLEIVSFNKYSQSKKVKRSRLIQSRMNPTNVNYFKVKSAIKVCFLHNMCAYCVIGFQCKLHLLFPIPFAINPFTKLLKGIQVLIRSLYYRGRGFWPLRYRRSLPRSICHSLNIVEPILHSFNLNLPLSLHPSGYDSMMIFSFLITGKTMTVLFFLLHLQLYSTDTDFSW